jgi:AcrR family transcriptional regulator
MHMPMKLSTRRGRSRDGEIDQRILRAASEHLALLGYEAMSIAAVAAKAETTRQALYRRWPTKAALAAAALQTYADVQRQHSPAPPHPFNDLIAELEDFAIGVSKPGRLSLVGTMLQDSTDQHVLRRYRAKVVAPRRSRILGILERAREMNLIDREADLEIAITLCTGSWYARALAGLKPPPKWAARTAALVWRAVGGR